MALAVYSPIPGSFVNSFKVIGNFFLYLLTTIFAVFFKFLTLE